MSITPESERECSHNMAVGKGPFIGLVMDVRQIGNESRQCVGYGILSYQSREVDSQPFDMLAVDLQ